MENPANFGYSTRLPYDDCAYKDRLTESTDPLLYNLNPNRIYSCDQCLSTLGPRTQLMGNSVSTTIGHPVATAQYLTDVESVLTNRNVNLSKCRKDEVNPVDVNKWSLKHMNVCGNFLDPMASRLSYPAYNYREMPINRFYNLPQNPQNIGTIFFDSSSNTKLESKDNFRFRVDKVRSYDPALPTEFIMVSPPKK